LDEDETGSSRITRHHNIVDITNFVMLEMDSRCMLLISFSGRRRIVAANRKKMKNLFLSTVKAVFFPRITLLICDGRQTRAIGGIMGG